MCACLRLRMFTLRSNVGVWLQGDGGCFSAPLVDGDVHAAALLQCGAATLSALAIHSQRIASLSHAVRFALLSCCIARLDDALRVTAPSSAVVSEWRCHRRDCVVPLRGTLTLERGDAVQ